MKDGKFDVQKLHLHIIRRLGISDDNREKITECFEDGN